MALSDTIRAKMREIEYDSFREIAEKLCDLEAEKADLEEQVEELTRERDQLAERVAS